MIGFKVVWVPYYLVKGTPMVGSHNNAPHLVHIKFYICILKKIIAISFLAIYLLFVTEAHQLLKLPVVFQHYAEHKAENPRISILEFLDMHYMHGSPMDDDYARDMQLPFKTNVDCVTVIATAFVPGFAVFSIDPPEINIVSPIFYNTPEFLPSSCLSSIWQPPRLLCFS